MYEPAFTDDFGYFEQKESFVNTMTNYFRSGSVTKSQSAKIRITGQSGRFDHTKNVPRDIGGGVMFRSPSSYIRAAVNTEWIPGAWERDYDTGLYTKRVDEGYPFSSGTAKGTNLSPIFNPAYVNIDLNTVHMLEVKVLNLLGDSKASLGIALAEATSTADMLAKRSSELWLALRAAKQRDWRQVWNRLGLPTGTRLTRSPAELYKEWHYGWQPLMRDINEIYNLLSEKLEPAFLMSAEKHNVDELQKAGSLENGVTGDASAHRVHAVKLWAKLDSSRARAANQIGLANPLAIGWELVPYSFVVDWGVPVGNVLAALTATNGLTFVGGYYSAVASGEVNATETPPLGWEETQPKRLRQTRMGYKRVPYGGFPRPVLYAKSPFSTSHVLSALALFQSRTGLR